MTATNPPNFQFLRGKAKNHAWLSELVVRIPEGSLDAAVCGVVGIPELTWEHLRGLDVGALSQARDTHSHRLDEEADEEAS